MSGEELGCFEINHHPPHGAARGVSRRSPADASGDPAICGAARAGLERVAPWMTTPELPLRLLLPLTPSGADPYVGFHVGCLPPNALFHSPLRVRGKLPWPINVLSRSKQPKSSEVFAQPRC